MKKLFDWLAKHGPFKLTEGNFVAGFANVGIWIALAIGAVYFLKRR